MENRSRYVWRRLRVMLALTVCAALYLAVAMPVAKALVIGPGQTATVDFAFGSVSGATPQPMSFIFEITTSGADPFDDFPGTFVYEFLDLGTAASGSVSYNALGETTLGLQQVDIATTDLTGSLRFGTLGESIDVIGVTMSVTDGASNLLVGTTSLIVPEAVDAQLPEPGALAALGFGLIGFAAFRRRRA